MACSERRLVAFVSGGLSDEERDRFDGHLLSCESCWRAVQDDRAGRLALDRLHQPAPPGLADRVRLAVELAAADGVWGRRFAGRLAGRRPGSLHQLVAVVAAGVLLLAALGLGIGVGTVGRSVTGGRAVGRGTAGQGVAGDPAALAAVVAMARREAGDGAGSSAPSVGVPARAPERLRLGGQRVTVRSLGVDGVVVVVATSRRPFPMPPASHVARGSSAHAWMATRGRIGVYSLDVAAGRESVLVAARAPAVELPSMLDRLRIAPR